MFTLLSITVYEMLAKYSKNEADCRWSRPTCYLSKPAAQKLYFVYSWLLHCTNPLSSFAQREQEGFSQHGRKQMKQKKSQNWYRHDWDKSRQGKCHTHPHLNDSSPNFGNTGFQILVSEPLKGWTSNIIICTEVSTWSSFGTMMWSDRGVNIQYENTSSVVSVFNDLNTWKQGKI